MTDKKKTRFSINRVCVPDIWEHCLDTEDNLKQTLPVAASISLLTTVYCRESTAEGTNMSLLEALASASLWPMVVLFSRLTWGTPYASQSWINWSLVKVAVRPL